MTLLLLALLAGLWAVAFMPALLRARRTHSPIATVGMFNRSLRALETGEATRRFALGPPGAGTFSRPKTTGGRWILLPPEPTRELVGSLRKKMIHRRRRLFESLLVACAVTFLAGLIPPLRVLLWLNLAGDLMLAAYIFFLVNDKRDRTARTAEPLDQASDDDYFDEPYLRAGHF